MLRSWSRIFWKGRSRTLRLRLLWQSSSKEEEQHTFSTIPREHWLIGSVHGMPKLTIKKLRPAGFARTAQFITIGLYSLMVLLV